MNPLFLELDEVLEIHHREIQTYGGSFEIRDEGLLKSAIAQPRSGGFGVEFFHEDLVAMAAAYLFHIAQNHSFEDGNKRTGLAAALIFLKMNGVTLTRREAPILEEATLAVASGRVSKAALIDLSRRLVTAR